MHKLNSFWSEKDMVFKKKCFYVVIYGYKVVNLLFKVIKNIMQSKARQRSGFFVVMPEIR